MSENINAGVNALFIVRRDDLTQSQFLNTELKPLEAGQVLLKLEKFGLTSNNVTYAALSKVMPYFKFFPIPDKDYAAEWGNLPVWGVGSVVESKSDELAVGARIFGYFPAANYFTLTPVDVSPARFRLDRPDFPAEYGLYSAYNILAHDPFNLPNQEDALVVFRPLFITGLLLADYLAAQDFRQAETVIISSASSKTSYGLAAALRSTGGCQVVGLASARNKAFAEALQVYDKVLTYDEIQDISPSNAVFVDVAGNLEVRNQLLSRLGSHLKLILLVGMTHLQAGSFGRPATGDVPSEVFFAPGWMAQRRKDLGDGFFKQLVTGWRSQMTNIEQHFELVAVNGQTALQQAYLDLTSGQSNPAAAYVVSL